MRMMKLVDPLEIPTVDGSPGAIQRYTGCLSLSIPAIPIDPENIAIKYRVGLFSKPGSAGGANPEEEIRLSDLSDETRLALWGLLDHLHIDLVDKGRMRAGTCCSVPGLSFDDEAPELMPDPD